MNQSRRRDQRLLADVAVAAVALVVAGLSSVAAVGTYPPGPLGGVLGTVVFLVMPAALIWRRTHPATSAATVYAGALLHFVVSPTTVLPLGVLVLVALYGVTVYGSRPARVAGLAGAGLGAALAAAGFGFGFGDARAALFVFVFAVGLVLATWALGLMRRARLMRMESLEERARRLEAERDQQARLAAAAERARIAREMHDVVAHSLSVVIAQADGGRYAAAADPAAPERALRTIAATGRAALEDVRRILGVLREDGGAERAPQPVHEDLEALLDTVRGSGLPVALVRTGPPWPLTAAAGLAAHRIVQEAVTNVLKHAGPGASATVHLRWQPEALVIEVDDDGRGAAAGDDGTGHGLVGMRERAALFGGTMHAGPLPGGGYRVAARLPRDAAAAPPTREAPVPPAAPTPHAPTNTTGAR